MATLQAFNIPLDASHIGRTTLTGENYSSFVQALSDRIQYPDLCQLLTTLPCGEHGSVPVIFWLDGEYRQGEPEDMNHQAILMIDALSSPREKLRTAIYGNCIVTGYNPATRELESLSPYALKELSRVGSGKPARTSKVA